MNKFDSRTGNVTGRITDRDSGQPLFGVNITMADSSVEAKTDLRGRYFISNLPPGDCTLQCSQPGYKTLSTLAVTVKPGETVQQDCQLICKDRIPLNEPVILLPLRLEIHKLVPQNRQTVTVAHYAVSTQATLYTSAGKFAPLPLKSEIRPIVLQSAEYWIRWYPDIIHNLTPVGKITESEKTAWEAFSKIYDSHKDAGTVRGLYKHELYDLCLDTLEIFYGIRPGRLTDAELVRCRAYDEAARAAIRNEGLGVREALGWQDMENPEMKAAWIAFTKAVGPIRARQIARHIFEGNWDFDNQDDLEEEPLDILISRGMPLPTLPEEISLYTIKDRKAQLLVEGIDINRKELLIAPTDIGGSLWMTDFQKAVQEGMGIIISDPAKVQQIDHADWLIVVGVNQTADSRTALQDILRRNNATGAFSIIAQDSPTNNSESSATQFSEMETDAETYLKNTRMRLSEEEFPSDPAVQIGRNTLDSQRLNHILKLSQSALSEMPGANSSEMTEAIAISALLWTPCTWHYRQLWGGFFNQYFPVMSRLLNNLKTGDLFVNHISARGTLPIIRIEDNPYGILPVISIRDWSKNLSRDAGITAKDAETISEFLDSMKIRFLSLSQGAPKVDVTTDEDKYETLLEILRSAPVSKRVDVRAFDSSKPADMSENPKYLNCPLVRDTAEGKEACVDRPYPETAYLCDFSHINHDDFNPACFQIDNNSPLLKRILKYLLSLVFKDAGDSADCDVTGVVMARETGEGLPGVKVTLGGAVKTATTDERGIFSFENVPAGVHAMEASSDIHNVVKYTHVAVNPGASNRVSLALSSAANPKNNIESIRQPASKNVQQPGGTIKGKVVDRRSGEAVAGAIVHLAGSGKSATTDAEGSYTFATVPAGSHQVNISTSGFNTATYTASVSEVSPVIEVNTDITPVKTGGVIVSGSDTPSGPEIPGGLDLLAEAAGLLKRVHPDKLEILLLETLDLFSHRLDAWFTGLANSVLEDCQRQNTQSPPTGIYGWLEKPGGMDSRAIEPEYIQAPSVRQATTAAILRNASIHNGTDDNSGAFQINLSSEQIRKGLWYMEGLRQGHLLGELLGYRLERIIHEESKKPKSEIKETDIFDLRDLYPLTLQETKDVTGELTAAPTIIDGEKFLNDQNTPAKFNQIKAQLNRIKDAAADIALCEVMDSPDNVARRGGWMDFLDGDGLPPQEEFIRSPRSGDIHGTKVFLPILSPAINEADASETNPRIIADPILAHYCEKLMPDFEAKEIVADLTKIDGTHTRPITFLMRELKMHPIDLVIGGVEELKLRVRYHLLSCWKENDSSEGLIASPCNILGPFPDFETSDELLNEVGVGLVTPASSADALSIFSYIEKAGLIRQLLHQNRTKNSLGTIPPEEIPLLKREQLDRLDPLAGFELLTGRLKRLADQLIHLISTTVSATVELKRRHLVLRVLQECQTWIQKIKDGSASNNNSTGVVNTIEQLKAKVNNMIDSDPDFRDLAEQSQLLARAGQLTDSDSNLPELIENLRAQFVEMEKRFVLSVNISAKRLVTSTNLPFQDVSRFGLEQALTIFPDEPTIAASVKILKLFDQIISTLVDQLLPIISDSPDSQNYLQCLKIVYMNAGEVNDIFTLNPNDVAAKDQQLRNRLPLSADQSQIIISRQVATAGYFEPLINSLLNSLKKIGQSISFTGKGIPEIISLLQLATDKEGMVVLTPYLLTSVNGSRPDWTIDLSELSALNGPAYLQEYQKVRPAISNLFELFDVGSDLRIYEDKSYQRLDDDDLTSKKQGNADYLYLMPPSGSPQGMKCLTFILVDQWQEGIPNPEGSEMTGIALRYVSPQAEAPNAVIIAVPPYRNKTEYWSTDLLANTLLETIELMQIRLAGSDEVRGDFLLNWLFHFPALLFPPTKDGASMFPSREQLFHGFDLGVLHGYVLASKLSPAEISRTSPTSTRNEAPKIGGQNE
ncbi:MAG: carboxypeptidase-like regulatory domain-containing protein [Acidobacteria bacterium]|nr:carboxypeptidase-like regulatory domain-containing protein [Acidobacteriota bacterium]